MLPAAATHLVTAIVADWDATDATLRLWSRRDPSAGWQPVGEPWPAVVGRAGTGWGAGLHGRGAPAGRPGTVKREGDGKSPAGVFVLRAAFGYASDAPSGTRTPYTRVTDTWRCIDDPTSSHYNVVLDERTTTKDWSSAEDMKRGDDLYAWVVEVAHNAQRTPGDGSCIFLHLWGGPGSTTSGCTAMAEDRLAWLLATLPAESVLVLLPQAEYTALADRWGLPR